MGIFGASTLTLIGVVWWVTNGYLEQQTNATIEAEVTGLVEQYRQRGIQGLESLIAERQTMSNGVPTVYLFADQQRKKLAGNLSTWPEGTSDGAGWYNFLRETSGNKSVPLRGRIFVLSDGRQLLVAQEQVRLEATHRVINRTFTAALGGSLLLALLGGFIMSYSVMRRIDGLNRTSREILAGRLQSRMPIRGVNDEFDQLSSNLNAMLDRIDDLMEGMRSVGDNIAHDLRTPLTRLHGRLENLSSRPELNQSMRTELGAVLGEADHLLETFSALLRISRLESGSHGGQSEEIELGVLLGDIWELYQVVGEDQGILVHLGYAQGQVHGDRNLLFQALCNLLDNAIKYSPAGSRVVLWSAITDNTVSIQVTDQGPGIPVEEREKVLARFYRSKSVLGIPGSGLGLSLVNAIAHHHGGRLILGENGPGLTATVQIPRRTASASSMSARGETPGLHLHPPG